MSKYEAKYKIHPKTEQEREFRKAYYITNPKAQLKRVREVIKMSSSLVKKNASVDKEWEQKLLNAIVDPIKKDQIERLQNQGFEFGKVYEATKRRLEIEIYIGDILQEAEKKKTKIEKIAFLIDKQFESHSTVFDNEIENIAFKEEVEDYIGDQLQKKVVELSNKEYTPTEGMLEPLKWTLNANVLGTIMSCLYDKGLIDGAKTDTIKFLVYAFPALSKSSLEAIFKPDTENEKNKAKQRTTKILTDRFIENLLQELRISREIEETIPNK